MKYEFEGRGRRKDSHKVIAQCGNYLTLLPTSCFELGHINK